MGATEYLNKTEAAAYLGCTPKTLYRYRAAGKLESIERINASNRKEIAYPLTQLEAIKGKNGTVAHNPSVDSPFSEPEAKSMEFQGQQSMEVQRQRPIKLSSIVQAEPFSPAILATIDKLTAYFDAARKTGPTLPIDRKLTLTIREAAEYAGVSQRFLKDLVRASAIIAIKDGRRTRISRGALEAYFSVL